MRRAKSYPCGGAGKRDRAEPYDSRRDSPAVLNWSSVSLELRRIPSGSVAHGRCPSHTLQKKCHTSEGSPTPRQQRRRPRPRRTAGGSSNSPSTGGSSEIYPHPRCYSPCWSSSSASASSSSPTRLLTPLIPPHTPPSPSPQPYSTPPRTPVPRNRTTQQPCLPSRRKGALETLGRGGEGLVYPSIGQQWADLFFFSSYTASLLSSLMASRCVWSTDLLWELHGRETRKTDSDPAWPRWPHHLPLREPRVSRATTAPPIGGRTKALTTSKSFKLVALKLVTPSKEHLETHCPLTRSLSPVNQ